MSRRPATSSSRSHPDVRWLRAALLRWARTVDRPLPWRGERDPYRVLVSEVMLQQTQASRVATAYPTFVERFPSVDALAAAPLEDVLRAWGDLGYPRRAVHLWTAARAVAERGSFPDDVAGLEALPGVGRYTARAVASFAFGRDEAVVEANVRRIVTRVFGLYAGSDVWEDAARLLPRGRAAAWNQALMDLGALVCRPRHERCDACPLRRRCAWAGGRRSPAPARTRVRFEATDRYARGRIVRALRGSRRPIRIAVLTEAVAVDAPRFERALAGLVRDGVVRRTPTTVRLG